MIIVLCSSLEELKVSEDEDLFFGAFRNILVGNFGEIESAKGAW